MLRPKWILSHLFVLALIFGMVEAGFWQIRRLDQKKDHNRSYTERTAEPAVPVTSLIMPHSTDAQDAAAEFRRVTATGHYRPDQEVIVRGRSQDDDPGSWVLTPLQLSDGTAVVINRGWIANDGSFTSVPRTFRAPTTQVTVTGIVQRTQTRGRFGAKDPKTGHLTSLARADIARLAKQVPEPIALDWVQLVSQRPDRGQVPRPLDPPVLDEGPHFSYAVQWFIFTTVAVIGYPLILRRRARELDIEARGEEADAAGDGGPDPDAPDPDDALDPADPRLEKLT